MKDKQIDIRHIDADSLAIERVKYGKGFSYIDEHGERIKDQNLLRRFRKMVIPPMWKDVLICQWEDGHIQATGRDLKGRKQYIYHSAWERARQQAKFKKMMTFANALPAMREKCHQLLKGSAWNREMVLALLILVLDESGIRIGNKQYAERNDTYGLTTLRRKHLNIEKQAISFEFQGKSGKSRTVEIDDLELATLIRKSAELPGYEIFRYIDEDGTMVSVDSEEVNEFITLHMGNEFSSKDFRTWVACRTAVECYPEAITQKNDAPRKKFANLVIRMVAEQLGNTPTVCRDYYVHPAIYRRIEKQDLPISSATHEDHESDLSASEIIALEVIQAGS